LRLLAMLDLRYLPPFPQLSYGALF
jgi:hypothetical protein